MASRRGPQIRLKHRLPNPPSYFVGRARELDALEAAVRRAPVAVVAGPAGIGKSAIVFRLVQERFSDRIGRAVYFGLRPGDPTSQLRHDLVRVLAQITGSKVSHASADPEELVESAIDLAESAGLFVVIDDVHHADAEEMNELLIQLMTYARESRWLATSRMEPRASALSGQIVTLGGLGDAELFDLARAHAPKRNDADHQRAVAAASGSPWLVAQYAASGMQGVALTRELLLEGLGAEVEAFLRVLSLLRNPIALELLSAVTPVPSASVLDELERRGLVVSSPAGIRLHDIVSGHLFPTRSAGADRAAECERIAEVLEGSGDSLAVTEAMRLYVVAGRIDALAGLLERQLGELFLAGHAPRVWSVIGELRDPRIVAYQIRCAAELGNPTALAAVHEPADPGLDESLAWAHATYAQGDLDSVQTSAGEIAARATARGRHDVALEASLLRARCLLHDGAFELAERELIALAPTGPQALRRDALLARVRTAVRADDADGVLGELRRRLEASDETIEASLDVAEALYELERRESADEILDALLTTARGGRATHLVARKAMLLRARIHFDRGEMAELGDVLEALAPYVRSTSLLRPFVLELEIARRLVTGDLADLERAVDLARREAAVVDRRLLARVGALAERWAIERGSSAETASSPYAELAAVRARRLFRQRGEIVSLAPARSASARIDARLFVVDHAIATGDANAACQEAEEAVREARRAGLVVNEAWALEALSDALLVAGRPIDEPARALVDLSRTLRSARMRLSGELYLGPFDPAVVERVAAQADADSIVGRRARALLGDAPPLDIVDRAVLAAIAARDPSFRVETVIGTPSRAWNPAWGLDHRRRLVWLPDGRTADFSTKGLLWKLVSVLAELGGVADKETLVLRVWDERVYHPGRHDPRLHMSMRKLREAIEDQPSNPARILTTDEGYRLGGVVRRIQ